MWKSFLSFVCLQKWKKIVLKNCQQTVIDIDNMLYNFYMTFPTGVHMRQPISIWWIWQERKQTVCYENIQCHKHTHTRTPVKEYIIIGRYIYQTFFYSITQLKHSTMWIGVRLRVGAYIIMKSKVNISMCFNDVTFTTFGWFWWMKAELLLFYSIKLKVAMLNVAITIRHTPLYGVDATE